jgi:propionate kinase
MLQKIMAINAGSSSLKFQLFSMPDEQVITKGMIERIGKQDAFFSIQYGEQKHRETFAVENHQQAVDHLLSALLDHEIIKSLDEIAGVGHRVAHGGEAFSDSACIDAAALQQIEHLGTLAPLHNPVNAIGIRAFMEALPHAKAVAVLIPPSIRQCPRKPFYTPCLIVTIRNKVSVAMAFTAPAINTSVRSVLKN